MIKHIFSDGSTREDITGVKVPRTRRTDKAYQAIRNAADMATARKPNQPQRKQELF